MATVKKFEDLEVWQLARQLENEVFQITLIAPLSKDYDLKGQMNRSSGSAMDNIVEGFGRESRLEFVQFLSISKGSVEEVQSQLYRCLDRKYITLTKFDELYKLTDRLCGKLTNMIRYLNRTTVRGLKFKNRYQ